MAEGSGEKPQMEVEILADFSSFDQETDRRLGQNLQARVPASGPATFANPRGQSLVESFVADSLARGTTWRTWGDQLASPRSGSPAAGGQSALPSLFERLTDSSSRVSEAFERAAARLEAAASIGASPGRRFIGADWTGSDRPRGERGRFLPRGLVEEEFGTRVSIPPPPRPSRRQRQLGYGGERGLIRSPLTGDFFDEPDFDEIFEGSERTPSNLSPYQGSRAGGGRSSTGGTGRRGPAPWTSGTVNINMGWQGFGNAGGGLPPPNQPPPYGGWGTAAGTGPGFGAPPPYGGWGTAGGGGGFAPPPPGGRGLTPPPPGARFMRRFNRFAQEQLFGTGMFYNILFGGWEMAQAQQALNEAGLMAQTADTVEQALTFQMQGIRGATAGPLGSIIGAIHNLTGASNSPWDVQANLSLQSARLGSIRTTAQTSRETGRMRAGTSAILSGTEAIRSIRDQTDASLQSNRSRQTELRELLDSEEEVHTGIIEFYGSLASTGSFAPASRMRYTVSDPGMRAARQGELLALRQQERAARQRADRQEIFIRDTQNLEMVTRNEAARMVIERKNPQAMETEMMRWAHTREMNDPNVLDRVQLRKVQERELKALEVQHQNETRMVDLSFEMRKTIANSSVQRTSVEGFEQDVQDRSHLTEMENLRLTGRGGMSFALSLVHDAENDALRQRHRQMRIQAAVPTAAGAVQTAMGLRRGTQVLTMQLGRDPLGAQVQQIANERDAALEMAAWIPFSNLRQNVEREITANANARTALVNQAWNDETTMIGLGMAMSGNILEAQRQRSPTAAAVAGIVGNAKIQSQQFVNAGRANFAYQTLDQSTTALELQRRDYLESFRAVQLDLTKMSTSNPRDQEDPATVMQTISDGLMEIVRWTRTLEVE